MDIAETVGFILSDDEIGGSGLPDDCALSSTFTETKFNGLGLGYVPGPDYLRHFSLLC